MQSNFPDHQADKDAFSISQHGEPCTVHQVKHEMNRCFDMIQENEDRLLMYHFETRWEYINMFEFTASSLTFSFNCKGGGLQKLLPFLCWRLVIKSFQEFKDLQLADI